MSTTTQQSKTFSLFSALPSELQDQIWSQAISSFPPRILELRKVLISFPNVPGPWTPRFASRTPIPSLLHTCRASRSLALTRWTLALPYVYKLDPPVPAIFFDFSSDIIFLDDPWRDSLLEMAPLPQADRERLDYIVIFDNNFMHTTGRNIAELIYPVFPCLKEVIIVARDLAKVGYNPPVKTEKTVVKLVGYKLPWINDGKDGHTARDMQGWYKERGFTAPAWASCDFARYDMGYDGRLEQWADKSDWEWFTSYRMQSQR